MIPVAHVLSAILSFSSIIAKVSGYQNSCQELEARFPAITFFSTDASFANDTVGKSALPD